MVSLLLNIENTHKHLWKDQDKKPPKNYRALPFLSFVVFWFCFVFQYISKPFLDNRLFSHILYNMLIRVSPISYPPSSSTLPFSTKSASFLSLIRKEQTKLHNYHIC